MSKEIGYSLSYMVSLLQLRYAYMYSWLIRSVIWVFIVFEIVWGERDFRKSHMFAESDEMHVRMNVVN